MFFHGIKLAFLIKQFPFLNPDAHVLSKSDLQLKDRLHLIQKFGLEPVHLLESSSTYPIKKCLNECFSFGDIILAYRKLVPPILQLSSHELGVNCLDVRSCSYVFIKQVVHKSELLKLGLNKPIFLVKTIEGDKG